MERRTFLTHLSGALIGGPAAGMMQEGRRQAEAASRPEFYVWRQYLLKNGPQPRRVADYLQKAAIPALNRLGSTPVGVFEVLTGLPTPLLFVLTPFATLDAAGAVDSALERDSAYHTAASSYMDAPASDPAYIRQEASILAAVTRMPRLEVPPATATGGPRLFELRVYESPSEKALRAKIRMFEEMGELDIFRRVGLRPVFFASTLAGPRMPNLTYLLVHDNMTAREKSWSAFRNDPEWKKLSSTPGYSNADIVSNITTVLLQPAAYSQI